LACLESGHETWSHKFPPDPSAHHEDDVEEEEENIVAVDNGDAVGDAEDSIVERVDDDIVANGLGEVDEQDTHQLVFDGFA
jgi:hypothetical protein